MLNISKYHKLIVGCSAIATASVGGFVQSADAAGISNQTVQSSPSTTLIANKSQPTSHAPNNGSNNGGVGLPGGLNGSNNGGKGPGNYYFDSNNGGNDTKYPGYYKGPGNYYFDSNNGGNGPKGPGYYYYDYGKDGLGYYSYDSNNGGIGPKGPAYYYGKGPEGDGYYSYTPESGPIYEVGTGNPGTGNPGTGNPGTGNPGTDNPGTDNPGTDNPGTGNPGTDNPGTDNPGTGNPGTGNPGTGNPGTGNPGTGNPGTDKKPPQQGSNGGGNNNNSLNGSNGGGPSRGTNVILASRGAAISKGIGAAQSKYDAALSALAAAEAATPNTSSKTSPVRYGREPQDIANCGCMNTDTADASSLSKEVLAAKAAEAEAAAELAAVKAEARKFLESVKGGESGSGSSQPIW